MVVGGGGRQGYGHQAVIGQCLGRACEMRHGGTGRGKRHEAWRSGRVAPTLSNTSKRASKVTMEMSAMEGAGPRK